MKENRKPIIFSSDMVIAILEGRKTQTRRIVKPQPDVPEWHTDTSGAHAMLGVKEFFGELTWMMGAKWGAQPCSKYPVPKLKYGKGNDVLWVREAFQKVFFPGEDGSLDWSNPTIRYAADRPEPLLESDGDGFQVFNKDGTERYIPWKPSIHMPKELCRLFLKIESIRIERLHDITADDALKEGVEYWNIDHEALEGGELVADFKNYTWIDDESYDDYHFPTFANAIDSFRTLWQSINGKESWLLNPWVWVIDFNRAHEVKETE